MSGIDYQLLANTYASDDVYAIGLFGSHARGDYGSYSDVDIVRFREQKEKPGTDLVDGNFVVVSDVSPAEVKMWFLSPEEATRTIRGLTYSKPLIDPDGYLSRLIQRAQKFTWTAEMQSKANLVASDMMIGWIEEVQKSLEGLRRNDVGRMLNGKHGLTWGMLNVMRVKNGVLLSGDNGAYLEVLEEMGADSSWSNFCREAFGVDGRYSLEEELTAGLRLYRLTSEMIAEDLVLEHRILVEEVVERITLEGI